MLKEQIEQNIEQRKDYLRNKDHAKFMESVLEQMNSLRMSVINLVKDMDDQVNEYLSVCKKYPIK